MLDKCPGAAKIRTPIPAYKKCPDCGEEVEIWSDELKAQCTKCGATVFSEDAPLLYRVVSICQGMHRGGKV